MGRRALLVIGIAMAAAFWLIGCGGTQPTTPETPAPTARPLVDAPAHRVQHTAVWTGTRMIVWGGKPFNDGAAYDPTTDTWTALSATGAPTARFGHAAVWTGSKMIVWGGEGLPKDPLNDWYAWFTDGAAYDPAVDRWTPISTRDAPPWSNGVVVWTGSRMLVWGGFDRDAQTGHSTPVYAGRAYDPDTDSWSPLASPEARRRGGGSRPSGRDRA